MSSILSTRACGVGTQTTSFPACPTSGLNVEDAVCAWALTVKSDKPSITNRHRRSQCVALMSVLPRTVMGMRGAMRRPGDYSAILGPGCAPGAAGAARPFHRVAVHARRVLNTARGEGKLIA